MRDNQIHMHLVLQLIDHVPDNQKLLKDQLVVPPSFSLFIKASAPLF